MLRLPSFRGEVSVFAFPPLAIALLLSQHALVAGLYRAHDVVLRTDLGFWLLPLRRVPLLPDLAPVEAALVFTCNLVIAWALALLCFRRARRSRGGYSLAALAIVPGLQMLAISLLAVLPIWPEEEEPEPRDFPGRKARHVLQGILAGAGIIVFAVLVSAVTFGAYGWGLFVFTPFVVGVTTAYVINRRVDVGLGETLALVMGAAALGTLALLMLALEGLWCILLAAPLGALAAAFGAVLGHAATIPGRKRGRPYLCVALLPAVFAFEAAMPPAAIFTSVQSIDIAAPPAAVWRALTSDKPIALPPGLVGRAGLAYPTGARIRSAGAGGERIGFFSTGRARERITHWAPERQLAFVVIDQPPAMEEMSPYRRVHAPHVEGYFETGETSFDLEPNAGGGTRLTIRASHLLRIDPVLYWEPVARWAIRRNTARVLADIKAKAER